MTGGDPTHSFVVPAYGESPWLGRCLESLQAQDVTVAVAVSTSTPFAGLEALCERHGAQLVVHSPNRGIGNDWNAALRAASTDWVTLAHQDDLYEPGYSAAVLDRARRFPDDLMAFTGYYELVGDARRDTVAMLRVKRLLLELGFLGSERITSRARKRLVLRFGNPIPCPAVALNRRALAEFAFRDDLRTTLDWWAWLDVFDRAGGVSYERQPLVGHRIHPSSETSAAIDDGDRRREDRAVFDQLWPRPVAALLSGLYTRSYRSNSA